MVRHPRRLLCTVCDAPCHTRRGLASHHKQSPACLEALIKKSRKSSARIRRTAMAQQRQQSPSAPANADDAIHEPIPDLPGPPIEALAQPAVPRQHRYVSVEEVPDEDAPVATIDYHPYAGAVYEGTYPTAWEQRLEADIDAKREPWHSFNSMDDWDVAKWLMTSGVSQTEMNKFLQLGKVRLTISCAHDV